MRNGLRLSTLPFACPSATNQTTTPVFSVGHLRLHRTALTPPLGIATPQCAYRSRSLPASPSTLSLIPLAYEHGRRQVSSILVARRCRAMLNWLQVHRTGSGHRFDVGDWNKLRHYKEGRLYQGPFTKCQLTTLSSRALIKRAKNMDSRVMDLHTCVAPFGGLA